MLPKQNLLTHLRRDLPEMAIAPDRVDADWIDQPKRWPSASIKCYLIIFDLVSILFDNLTFASLVWVLHAKAF